MNATNIQFKLARCIGKIDFVDTVNFMGQGAAAKLLIDLLATEGLSIVRTDTCLDSQEREACAQIADSYVTSPYVEVGKETAASIAKAIRARRERQPQSVAQSDAKG